MIIEDLCELGLLFIDTILSFLNDNSIISKVTGESVGGDSK